ncbi:TRAP transporter substrate-binding protein DctP [Bacillus piscicola]|uniref:TRAP transporter substrate-binding protein DctP n=1 Tax=Bacillus piscicola TaxID=1632684 RepID=UPI001F090FE2|nr:TRAP transporter substrate-binding protein DctP [Bacillus piscicola]
MYTKRKGMLFVFGIVCIFVLAACGGGNTGEKEEATAETASDTEETFTFKVAGQYPEDHPNTQALKKFKETVEQESNGAITLDLYPAAQLGDYTLVYEEIMRGTIDMGLISIPTDFDERLAINWVNYLAESYDVARDVYAPDSFFYQTNEKLNEEAGVKYLGFHVEGFGGIGAMEALEKPTEPGVDKGIQLRVPPIEMYKVTAEDLGFRTVSIPYAELYQAMQTGVADGWAGGPPVANYHDVGDLITHYYQYNDFFEMVPMLMNMDKWESIGEENQQIIQDAAQTMMEESFNIAEENDQIYRDKMAENDIEIITFSDEELKKLADYTRETTWPKLKETLGDDIYNGLTEEYQ